MSTVEEIKKQAEEWVKKTIAEKEATLKKQAETWAKEREAELTKQAQEWVKKKEDELRKVYEDKMSTLRKGYEDMIETLRKEQQETIDLYEERERLKASETKPSNLAELKEHYEEAMFEQIQKKRAQFDPTFLEDDDSIRFQELKKIELMNSLQKNKLSQKQLEDRLTLYHKSDTAIQTIMQKFKNHLTEARKGVIEHTIKLQLVDVIQKMLMAKEYAKEENILSIRRELDLLKLEKQKRKENSELTDNIVESIAQISFEDNIATLCYEDLRLKYKGKPKSAPVKLITRKKGDDDEDSKKDY